MSDQTMKIYEPKAPSHETLVSPARTIRSADGNTLITYCPVNRCGAFYRIPDCVWSMYCPITPDLLVSILAGAGIALLDGADLRTWLDAIGAKRTGMLSH
ncbi:MAG: hypothetical protein QM741_13865 [Rudaea sp.]|uniref:hypothetical protein n=1 Tax=Rudaea sp. TaxID=2136325 RepID=UPI0039E21968